MKHFEQLTDEQKEKAVDLCIESLVTAILETGEPEIFLSGRASKKIRKAIKDGERQLSPWFDGERIFEAAEKQIRKQALVDAQDAIYLENGEYTVEGRW